MKMLALSPLIGLTIKMVTILLLLFIAWEAIRIFVYTQKGVRAGKIASLANFPQKNSKKRLLLIGDCGAVSVGVTDKQYSIAGQLHKDFPSFEIDNASKNAMLSWQLQKRLAHLPNKRYDTTIIFIGSMDSLFLTPHFFVYKQLKKAILELQRRRVENIVLVSPCNLGVCPLFRFPLNILYDWRSQKMASLCEKIATEFQIVHAPLYRSNKQSGNLDKKQHFANDLTHPNDEGHKLWYNLIRPAVFKTFE